MTFMVVVVVFLIVQMAGSLESWQADGWYKQWSLRCRGWFDSAAPMLLMQLMLPLLGLWLLLDLVGSVSILLLFLLTIPVLLYSLGRDDFVEWLRGYHEAFRRNDNEVAADYADRLGADLQYVDNWPALNREVLRRAGYRGFERWFAVLFWFVLLGPLGAVFYRLTVLSATNRGNPEATRALAQGLLWYLEWPAVRLAGLSFALTGDFSGCYARWVAVVLDTDKSAEDVLETCIHGALDVDEQELASASVGEQEIEELQTLFSRSLLLWICALALFSLI